MQPSTFWLVALVVFAIGEALTAGLTSIWFAVGALAALITVAFGGNPLAQTIVFIIVSGITMALVRPLAKKYLKPRQTPTNADRILGKTALVSQSIDNTLGQGQVNVSGQTWSARSQYDDQIPEGTQVRILRIEGVKVFVERI